MKWKQGETDIHNQGYSNIWNETASSYTIFTKYGVITALIYCFPETGNMRIRFDTVIEGYRIISYFITDESIKIKEHSLICKANLWIKQKIKQINMKTGY